MNWWHTSITLVLLLVISGCAPGPPKLTKAQQTFPTSWLAGTWSTTISDQMIRVTWDAPTGNHMAGAIRYFSLDSGELQSESVLVIRQSGGKLTLTIMGDKVPVETLKETSIESKRVVFEGSGAATVIEMAYTRVDRQMLAVERTVRMDGQDKPVRQRWTLVPSQPSDR